MPSVIVSKPQLEVDLWEQEQQRFEPRTSGFKTHSFTIKPSHQINVCLLCPSACMSLYLPIRPSIHQSVILSFYLSVHPSVCLPLCLFDCLSVHPSFRCLPVSFCPSFRQSGNLSFCQSVSLSVCPSVLPSSYAQRKLCIVKQFTSSQIEPGRIWRQFSVVFHLKLSIFN